MSGNWISWRISLADMYFTGFSPQSFRMQAKKVKVLLAFTVQTWHKRKQSRMESDHRRPVDPSLMPTNASSAWQGWPVRHAWRPSRETSGGIKVSGAVSHGLVDLSPSETRTLQACADESGPVVEWCRTVACRNRCCICVSDGGKSRGQIRPRHHQRHRSR